MQISKLDTSRNLMNFSELLSYVFSFCDPGKPQAASPPGPCSRLTKSCSVATVTAEPANNCAHQLIT